MSRPPRSRVRRARAEAGPRPSSPEGQRGPEEGAGGGAGGSPSPPESAGTWAVSATPHAPADSGSSARGDTFDRDLHAYGKTRAEHKHASRRQPSSADSRARVQWGRLRESSPKIIECCCGAPGIPAACPGVSILPASAVKDPGHWATAGHGGAGPGRRPRTRCMHSLLQLRSRSLALARARSRVRRPGGSEPVGARTHARRPCRRTSRKAIDAR